LNFEGTRTLFNKEVLRFWKVSVQTVAAPVLTAVLYLLIFGHVLEAHVQVYPGVGYTSFLIPGLVMMSVLQNAYANSSSSQIQSKVTCNLVFLLVTQLTHWAWFAAYVGASVVRARSSGSVACRQDLARPRRRAAVGRQVRRRRDARRAGSDRRL
jgi:ABC-2 type transport system permease protein